MAAKPAVEWAALEARRHRAPLRIVSAAGMPPMRAYDASPQRWRTRSAVRRRGR